MILGSMADFLVAVIAAIPVPYCQMHVIICHRQPQHRITYCSVCIWLNWVYELLLSSFFLVAMEYSLYNGTSIVLLTEVSRNLTSKLNCLFVWVCLLPYQLDFLLQAISHPNISICSLVSKLAKAFISW